MFSPIDLSHRERLQEVFFSLQGRNCDYSFVNAYAWQDLTAWEVGEIAGCVCLRYPDGKGAFVYLYPAGEKAKYAVEEICARERAALSREVTFYGGEEMKQGLPEAEFFPQRGLFDYLYRAEELLNYSSALRTQRQQAAAFEREYPRHRLIAWNEESLFWEAAERLWGREDEDQRKVLSRLWECRNFLEGAILTVEGKIAGITAASFLCGDTLDVHLEKADTSYRGIYAFLRREFLRRVYQKREFSFINREEDMNIEGLREAKLRLKPVALVEKYLARLKG